MKKFNEDLWFSRILKLNMLMWDDNLSIEKRIRVQNIKQKMYDMVGFYLFGICIGKSNWMIDKL